VLSPKLRIVADIGQLGADFDVIAVRHDAPAYERGYAQVRASFLHVHVFTLVAEDGVARLHFEVWNMGEAGDQRLRDAVTQIVNSGISAFVGEGKYGDRVNLRCFCRSYVPEAGRRDRN
jgi:hypothetical protein